MSILPKKQWHTKNPQNKERVRKDLLDASIENEELELKALEQKRKSKWDALRSKKHTSDSFETQRKDAVLSSEPSSSNSSIGNSQKEKNDFEKFEKKFDMSFSSVKTKTPWYMIPTDNSNETFSKSLKAKNDEEHTKIEDPMSKFISFKKPGNFASNLHDNSQSSKSIDSLRRERLLRQEEERRRIASSPHLRKAMGT